MILHLLHSMLDTKGKPMRSLVLAVQSLAKYALVMILFLGTLLILVICRSTQNGRLLIPILTGLPKEDVVDALPILISVDQTTCKVGATGFRSYS